MRPDLCAGDIAPLLAYLADRQLHGSGAQMAACFRMPVAYYLPDRVMVFSDRGRLARRFETHRTYLQFCRVKRIEARALALRDASPERALVGLTWHYLSECGETLRRSEVQYVMSRAAAEHRGTDAPGDLHIELVDYSILAFPQFMQARGLGARA